MATLLVAGTLTLDTTHRAGRVHHRVPGGSALYAAFAARLATRVRIVSTVGTDFPLSDFGHNDIDTSDVEVVAGPTFHWTAAYSDSGDERTTLGREPGVEAGRLPPVVHPAGRDDLLLLGSMNPRKQQHVLDACPLAGRVGLDSMTHWWHEEPALLRRLLSRVQVLFVNEEELAIAAPGGNVEALLELGPAMVIVKCGSRGAWLQRRGAPRVVVPASPLRQLADPTGAGDAFAGACMSALAADPAIDDTSLLRYSSAVAAFAVEGVGTAALSATTPAEVQRRARDLPA